MIIDAHAHIFNADCVPFRSFLERVSPLAGLVASEVLEWTTYESEVDASRRGPARRWIARRLKARGAQGARVRRAESAIRDAGGPHLLEVLRLASGEVGAIARTLVEEGAREGVGLTVNLPMDLEHAYRRREALDIPYPLQLQATLRACRAQAGKLVSFVFFDPRRADALDLVKHHCESHPEQFKGVKVYPSLGYLPLGTRQLPQAHPAWDGKLRELYAYCAANRLPITTHCSRGGVHSDHPATFQGRSVPSGDLSWFYRTFSAPLRWLPVLREFPDLKLNLAHFGGGAFWRPEPKQGKGHPDDAMWRYDAFIGKSDWREDIVTLMESFPGVYTDLSYHPYSLHPEEEELNHYRTELAAFLKVPGVANRVMFGSDMHLVRLESAHRAYVRAYRTLLESIPGVADRVLRRNAQRFLGLPIT